MANLKVLDTNKLIYQLNRCLAQPLRSGNFATSIVSEIEVLGFPGLNSGQAKKHRSLIDAIIAATAIELNADLLTLDLNLLNCSEVTTTSPILKPLP
jgi:hypothetical protein